MIRDKSHGNQLVFRTGFNSKKYQQEEIAKIVRGAEWRACLISKFPLWPDAASYIPVYKLPRNKKPEWVVQQENEGLQ